MDHSVLTPIVVLAAGVLLGMWAWCSRLDADSRVIVPPCRIESVQSLKTIDPPSLFDPATLTLSIVVPTYNEELRLPAMLDETLSYLKRRSVKQGPDFTWEVIVVDDGSADGTVRVAAEYTRRLGVELVRTLRLPRNRGKGGAVRMGVLAARGERVLFADSDGATLIDDLERLEDAMRDLAGARKANGTRDPAEPMKPAFVLGSRAHLEEPSKAQRTFFRTFLMHGFHFLVSLVVGRGVRDTQCGFKLLSRSAARLLVPNQRLQRWAFDVELVALAQRLGVPMREVQVTWTEIKGSKLRMLSVASMALELVAVKVCYTAGLWGLRDVSSAAR